MNSIVSMSRGQDHFFKFYFSNFNIQNDKADTVKDLLIKIQIST